MVSRRDFLGILSAAGALAALDACHTGSRSPDNALSDGGKIDRFAVLRRHNPSIRSPDPHAVLSVGNGTFAFNVDCTGLQSLPGVYNVIPLATLSDWGWHSVPPPVGKSAADMNMDQLRLKRYPFHGRQVPYATDSTGQSELFNYLRENPHRLNLGRIGLLLDAKPLQLAQLARIDQRLDLSSGLITSRFLLAGQPVEVLTCAHPAIDGIGIRIDSPLLAAGRLRVSIAFGYGARSFGGDGADWASPDAHQTILAKNSANSRLVTLNRLLDATRYWVRVDLSDGGDMEQAGKHQFQITGRKTTLELPIAFATGSTPSFTFGEARAASQKAWHAFWNSGAAVDLSNCTDPRAHELERRVVLSQYLTAIHCAGDHPAQETGLLCNSWYGKFHLEMHWWHSVHFAAWNRWKHFLRPMGIYAQFLESSRARASLQGFDGARWPKMTSPDGQDSPSSVGPLLIWQQPHPIYYAELAYRADPSAQTLGRWGEIVLATAEFMASFAQLDPARGQYVLGPAIRTVPEYNRDADINPTWELTAWRLGLSTAQKWLERMGRPRNEQWDRILERLAPAPVANGLYLQYESQPTFTTQWAYEHPSMLGALGVLPGQGIDPAIMAATAQKVREVWDFSRVWGWDYPVAAMAAARTNQPDLALDFLLMDAPTNHYLPNGCCFQRNNVPAYFPANGGLLSAIAMMAGGWDGSRGASPGFPKNGRWNLRAQGFARWV